MRELSRRDLMRHATALAALQTVRAAVKPVRITDVDLFGIDVPVTAAEAEAGFNHRFLVAKVTTDAGINGYSFAAPPARTAPDVKRLLVGKDLFNIEQHLSNGLGHWGGIEHALWDAIGKIAGQPAYKLLGGSRDRVKAYVTCVWKGNADQAQVKSQDQVDQALRLQKAGFKGMKIRAWRPDPMNDVHVCREILAATGKEFSLMFDRTAQMPVSMAGQKVWDFETGLKAARALQEAGAYWLEEPFAREDYESPAKLARMVDILITGGEGYATLEPFRQCLLHQTYDVLQPDGRTAGGIFSCRKVGILAEAFHVPCILHGSMALLLAGWLQATLAIGSEWQEIALITPPLLPEEQWSPGLKVLKSKRMFELDHGELLAPPYPGIGLEIDEDALARYRIKA